MWKGRVSVDSSRSPASPALITYNTVLGEMLVLMWCGSDGTVYMATGMEQTGVISPVPTPISTVRRFALVEYPSAGIVSICYIASDQTPWYSSSPFPDVIEFLNSQQLTPQPMASGPAVVAQGGTLDFAAFVAFQNELLYLSGPFGPGGFAAPTQNAVSALTSDYAPALGITSSGVVQLAWADWSNSNRLTVISDYPGTSGSSFAEVYPDECNDGPALVTTVSGYAAAFVNIINNIVLLYGVDKNNPQNVNRVILHDASPYTPAIATVNGVTYVAWIGADIPDGKALFFADLDSMPVLSCPITALVRAWHGGAKAGEVAARLRELRDTSLAAEASGRWLIALLDQHSTELERLFDSHPDLRERAWDLLEQVEPIATANRPFSEEVIEAGEDMLRRLSTLASAPLQESARQVGQLVASLRGRTLADGLTAASRTWQGGADASD
jgi:hypothetical protein